MIYIIFFSFPIKAYLGTKETGFTVLKPVLSRIIRNKEPNSDLQISNYSDNTSPVKGMQNHLNVNSNIDHYILSN